LELAVERFDLDVEGLPAAGEIPKGGLDAGEEEPLRLAGQLQEVIDLGTKAQAAVDQRPLSLDPPRCRAQWLIRL
jgi:hypothetical protein